MRKLLNCLLIFCVLLLASCDKLRVYDEYVHVGSQWHKDSIASFELKDIEIQKPYNLFINVRNNNEYEFSNLYLVVKMEEPNGLTKVDTLQYLMANPDGTLMGDGFSDVKDNKLVYKLNYRFDKKGPYKVNIGQAVRKTGKIEGEDYLKGVTDIGFRIETIP